MVVPLDPSQLTSLPMAGGTLHVRFENREDVETQLRDFLPNMGLFVSTEQNAQPFSEFQLILHLPGGQELEGMPARLVQVVPYGDHRGLMLQLLKLPPEILDELKTWLEQGAFGATESDQQEASQLAVLASELGEIQFDESDSEDEWEPKGKPAVPEWVLLKGLSRVATLEKLRTMTPNERCRVARYCDRNVRSILMRDNESVVVMFLLKNPQITRQEVIDISKMPTINHQTVSLMLANKQWSMIEELRYNLVRNPKTPLSIALQLTAQLNMKHLREIAKDWGMKSQIKQMALRLVVKRGGSE